MFVSIKYQLEAINPKNYQKEINRINYKLEYFSEYSRYAER